LMPRQLDAAGAALLETSIRNLGVHVHLGSRITAIGGAETVTHIDLAGEEPLEVDMVIVSAGIRPRDELARSAGLRLAERGGIVVDGQLRTSDTRIFAIGEVASHDGLTYGLVAPGYEMADVLAKNLTGSEASFAGSDQSAKLKLLGTDVASFGDPFHDSTPTKAIVFEDQLRGIYKKLVLAEDGTQLLGGILVGEAGDWGRLTHLTRSKTVVSHDQLGITPGSPPAGAGSLPDCAQICSCNDVLAGTIRARIEDDALTTVAEVKACTRAGSGCGGCLPMVTDILTDALKSSGRSIKQVLCDHFDLTRNELFEIVASTRIRTFDELIARSGRGTGCEICKPTVASILASVHNEPILAQPHRTLQDSNDRFLANIQRNGLYSIVPRVPAGEITPDQLVTIGSVAKKYGLYTKITGGQRIDLFGARLEQLPDIWEELVNAGFESGHAYGKALRTVKSCVGSTWCRYGVQDSTAFAIRVENRYKGIRAPHKLKSAVSGCTRECAEAQSKDFGLIATEKGWNLYVCGNGGVKPRHADLLATNIDDETAIRYLDRFIMFYIRTADRLTRTSVWLEKMEGGLSHLRDVVVNDSLGIAADLEREMQFLVDTYECEWANVVRDPEKRATFRHFANDASGDDTIAMQEERGQLRPADAPPLPPARATGVRRLPILKRSFVRLASVSDVPKDGGIAVKYGDAQIAIFNLASRGEWYATQNACPHTQAMVLARGITGDQGGTPKVACPLHKKTFDLQSGECLSGDELQIATFAVRIVGDDVFVDLPPADELAPKACTVDLAS
ncbi:MAG TPA: nitrite reductase large subunit NirB, partial [Labilithrix sp.]|nr:nitrite reductase large subunit NirB [Labilithrix sp.]